MEFQLLHAVLGTAIWGSVSEPPVSLQEADWREYLIQAAYLAASVFFILGLKGLTAPDKARRGMQLAAIGMLIMRGGLSRGAAVSLLALDQMLTGVAKLAALGAAALLMPMPGGPGSLPAAMVLVTRKSSESPARATSRWTLTGP